MKINFTKKPWGGFETFTKNEKSTVKILIIKPGQMISLQKHNNRKEFWKILENSAKVTIGKKIVKLKKGDTIAIKKNTFHRIEALSKEVRVLEISFGKFDEKDIIRYEDKYGRV